MKKRTLDDRSTPKGAEQTSDPKRDASTSAERDVNALRLKRVQTGTDVEYALDCKDSAHGAELLKKAVGSRDEALIQGILTQLIEMTTSDGDQVEKINFMLSALKGNKGKDPFEIMLAAQMVVVHTAMMRAGKTLAHSESPLEQDLAERSLNRLTRTYALQMETLKRYRTGGEQTVTVQHIAISDGSQAIVGNVTQAQDGGRARKAGAPSRLAIADAKTVAMPPVDQAREKEVAPIQAHKMPRQR